MDYAKASVIRMPMYEHVFIFLGQVISPVRSSATSQSFASRPGAMMYLVDLSWPRVKSGDLGPQWSPWGHSGVEDGHHESVLARRYRVKIWKQQNSILSGGSANVTATYACSSSFQIHEILRIEQFRTLSLRAKRPTDRPVLPGVLPQPFRASPTALTTANPSYRYQIFRCSVDALQ